MLSKRQGDGKQNSRKLHYQFSNLCLQHNNIMSTIDDTALRKAILDLASGSDQPLKHFVKELQAQMGSSVVSKKDVNRVLYTLARDGLAKKVVESPPVWCIHKVLSDLKAQQHHVTSIPIPERQVSRMAHVSSTLAPSPRDVLPPPSAHPYSDHNHHHMHEPLPQAAGQQEVLLRIFWHFENTNGCRQHRSPLDFFKAVLHFFKQKGVIRTIAHHETRVFLRDPSLNQKPNPYFEVLRDAQCTIVRCASQKEDVDREIEKQIRQLSDQQSRLNVFSTAKPAIVIISDDDVLNSSLQAAQKAGLRTYRIVDAPRSSQNERLGLYCDATVYNDEMHDVQDAAPPPYTN